MEKVNLIEEHVNQWVDRNIEMIPEGYRIESTFGYIKQLCVSMLCTKWGIGPQGGGFVQAVVNNDLMGAVSRADGMNSKLLKFYCSMLYNIGKPESL
jgi:hypothetical protein